MSEEPKKKQGWQHAGPGRPSKGGASPKVQFRLAPEVYEKLMARGGPSWAKEQITRLLTAEKPKLIKSGKQIIGAIEKPRQTKKGAPTGKNPQGQKSKEGL